jgi:hypothetical protein
VCRPALVGRDEVHPERSERDPLSCDHEPWLLIHVGTSFVTVSAFLRHAKRTAKCGIASRWFVIAGAAAALGMAIARWDYFWIANVIYLGFVLWAIVGSVVKLVAYRRGL